MASSTDSTSNGHAKESALQSMPQDIHDVILEIAQAMEGKTKEEYQALLNNLKNSQTKLPPEEQATDIAEDNDTKPITDKAEHEDKGESLESPDKVNDVVPSLEDSGTDSVSHPDGQDQSAHEDTKPTAKGNNVAVEGQDTHEDVNEAEKEERKDYKDKEKNGETTQGHDLSNEIPNVQNQNQGVSTDESECKADKRCLDSKGNHHIPNMKNKDKDEVNIPAKNSVTVEYRKASNSDENINELKPSGVHRGKEHEEVVASSDDDMAPSTPASGGQSSGSDLSESPSERQADHVSARDSLSHIESKTPDPSTAPLSTSGTSYSQPQASDSLNQASLKSTYERTPLNSNLPTRTQDNSPLTKENYHSPTIQDPGINNASTRTRPLPVSTQEYGSLGQFYTLPGAQYPTPEISREPMRNRDSELSGTGQLGTSTGMPAGFQHPGLNDVFLSTIPTSSSALRTSKQVPMTTTVSSSTSDTSTIMVKPQNSISTINTSPSIPLYYQPHVVMQDQLPVLVLRPVLAQDPSSSPQVSSSDSKGGLTLENLPLMFPLGSDEVKGNADDPRVQPKFAPSVSVDDDAYFWNKRESFPIGAELVSGYASSVTESEMDEAPLRKAPPRSYRDSARPPISRAPYEQSYGQSSSEPFDWRFPSSNPFTDEYNNTPTTGVSDLKLSSSRVPSTMSEEKRFLYNKQGARSKATNMTNPFAPEIPPRTDIEELSRNDFRSIPKSMLASTDTQPRTSDVQPQPKGDRRRLSSDSMVTLLESECEDGPSMDITEAVARQGMASDNSYQPQIFEPSSGPFFEENTYSFSQHSLGTPATCPTSQPNPVASIPRIHSASTKTKEEPRKTKPKLVS